MTDAPTPPPAPSSSSPPHSPAPASTPTPVHPRHGLIGSFGFAFAGIGYLFRTQRNARIHAAVAIIVCALAAWLRVTRVEWAILILAIACVLILEGLNTALEAAVDLASPQIHPLAKIAKDITAGMVLIAAIASAIVGLLILGPPLLHRLNG
jgi:diacylglycerol kinase